MNSKQELNEKIDLLTERIETLNDEIRGLRKERDNAKKEAEASKTIRELREEITALEIQKSKKTEEHEREKRETLHMVGLERKRSEAEAEMAKREATVSVREEALTKDMKRFEDQMKFHDERFTKEVDYLKSIMGDILLRLPTVTVDKTVTQKEK